MQVKIKIVEPGMETYTGPVGEVNFVDGVSVEPLWPVQLNRISSCFRVETLEGDQCGVGSAYENARDMSMDKFLADEASVGATNFNLPYAAEHDAKAIGGGDDETHERTTPVEPTGETKSPAISPDEAPYVISGKVSRADLEAVADSKGIAGLRRVGAAYEVSAKSIGDLIDLILASQDAKNA